VIDITVKLVLSKKNYVCHSRNLSALSIQGQAYSGNSEKSAILREKQLKKWKRNWKLNLIEKMNP
jgi:predicted GIY-YIG superfamily endonuclease